MKIIIDFADCDIVTRCVICGSDLQWEEKHLNGEASRLDIFPCKHCTEEAYCEGLAKGKKK